MSCYNFILIFPGLLAGVGELRGRLLNGSSILLSWIAPYTLDNVPITGYSINDSITTNDTSIISSVTDPDVCMMTFIAVSPINDVGIGQTDNISFYYERG